MVRLNKKGNIKVGTRTVTYSKLKGDEPVYIRELDTCITGTCGKYCEGCSGSCYVNSSYRYPSVKYSHAVNTIESRLNLEKHHIEIRQKLARMRSNPEYFRINQSGELESIDELKEWIVTVKENPNIKFWLYTKNVPAIKAFYEMWRDGELPENITLLVSVWHESNLDLYLKVQACPNIKAFVYDDGTFHYAAHGLIIQTYCHAYNEKGKLNHDITCERCQKCFNRLASCKVIGCYAH